MLLVTLLRVHEARTVLPTAEVAAFAAGFGGGKVTGSKNKSKRKKGGLSEMRPTPTPSPATGSKGKPKIDKWGLPIATLDDVFPPMSAEIELIPVDPNSRHSIAEIEDCLKDHIDLRLSRFFDENGVKKGRTGKYDMNLKLLHKSPPVLAIENFFDEDDCLSMQAATDSAHEVNSATFSGALSTRTSTSWFCRFVDVPALLAKANQILNVPLDRMEEPQVVRYKKGQEFSWHYDEVPAPQLANGGQRLATLLVYLNDISDGCGGGTTFRDLEIGGTPLLMQPKKGSALLFFPAFRDGTPDDRTLHKSELMTCNDEKWIVQMWVHEDSYKAILPPGNSNEAARALMETKSRRLGYIR